MSIPFEIGEAFARNLDMQDELKEFREEFVIADPELIYLDGNSLGRLPRATVPILRHLVASDWGDGLIRGWNRGWWEAPRRIGEKIAPLIGAEPSEVIVADSTSVNLFKLAVAALRLQGARDRVVSDVFNFPSDLYVLQGVISTLGGRHELVLMESKDSIHMEDDEIKRNVNERTALIELSHVTFKSGFLYDMERVTRLAHDAGALVLWDLCHSVGALPVHLNASGADMAIGCTYKYLNAGPGAPAFLFVRKDLQEKLGSPIWGWVGQDNPFGFDLEYRPAPGINRYLAGSPPILSMTAVEPAVELIQRAGLDRIRAKSVRLTEYMIFLYDRVLASRGFVLGSPRDEGRRGSQVSIRHADAFRIIRAMIEDMKVIPDFRAPDNIRLGFPPLYVSFHDVWEAVERIAHIIDHKVHERFTHERPTVT
jgi:kynureninase